VVLPLVERGWTQSVAIAWLDARQPEFCNFGQARAGGGSATPDTLYEIGSLTKLFTGVLLGSMLADGSVRADAPVVELVPRGTSVPAFKGRKITLLHLATHRSGLPRLPNNVAATDPENPYAQYDNSGLFTYLASAKLNVAPGSQHLYSNLGAALLGQALAARAGQSYEQLIETRVLQPLGLRDTYFVVPEASASRFATGHDADGAPRGPWDFKSLAPAGGLRSTARDMARFAAAVLEAPRGPLGEAIGLAQVPRADAAAGRRIGLFFQIRPDGVLWHNGATQGFSSYLAVDPERGAGIVLLTSSNSRLTDALGDKLFDFQAGASLEPFELPEDAPLTASQLAEYVGTYAVTKSLSVRVFLENGALYTQATEQDAIRIWPSAVDHFYVRVSEARLRFERTQRRVSAMVLEHDGVQERAIRLNSKRL
jgi:CubicO group peptidase (beta-lactamase class C family)